MKEKTLRLMLLAAGLLAISAGAAAQTVYRCGSSYSQQPCPGGTAVTVDDERSAAQRAQTEKAAQRDAKAAEAMEKARMREEAKPTPVGMPPPKASEEEARARAASKRLEHFSAKSPRPPGEPASKKKAAATKTTAAKKSAS